MQLRNSATELQTKLVRKCPIKFTFFCFWLGIPVWFNERRHPMGIGPKSVPSVVEAVWFALRFVRMKFVWILMQIEWLRLVIGRSPVHDLMGWQIIRPTYWTAVITVAITVINFKCLRKPWSTKLQFFSYIRKKKAKTKIWNQSSVNAMLLYTGTICTGSQIEDSLYNHNKIKKDSRRITPSEVDLERWNQTGDDLVGFQLICMQNSRILVREVSTTYAKLLPSCHLWIFLFYFFLIGGKVTKQQKKNIKKNITTSWLTFKFVVD